MKLVYHGVSVLSLYLERNTKNDLLFCMQLVASQAVGVRQNCLLYGLFFLMCRNAVVCLFKITRRISCADLLVIVFRRLNYAEGTSSAN